MFAFCLRILEVLSLDNGPDTGLSSGYVDFSVPPAIEYFVLQTVTLVLLFTSYPFPYVPVTSTFCHLRSKLLTPLINKL